MAQQLKLLKSNYTNNSVEDKKSRGEVFVKLVGLLYTMKAKRAEAHVGIGKLTDFQC